MLTVYMQKLPTRKQNGRQFNCAINSLVRLHLCPAGDAAGYIALKKYHDLEI